MKNVVIMFEFQNELIGTATELILLASKINTDESFNSLDILQCSIFLNTCLNSFNISSLFSDEIVLQHFLDFHQLHVLVLQFCCRTI